jgi:tRNA A-37 threonylcarbamoyl transferase component Bud32
MVETQIVAEYNYPPARLGLWGTWAFAPVWGLFAPVYIAILLFSCMLDPRILTAGVSELGGPVGVLGSLFAMLLLLFVGLVLVTFWSDNKLYLTRDGLRISAPMRLLSGFPRDVGWRDIKSIRVTNTAGNDRGTLIVETDLRQLLVDLRGLSEKDFERLVLSINLWATSSSKSESFQLCSDTFERTIGSGDGLTKMWEDELQKRFSATSFVPLEPESELMNGELRIVRQLSFGGLSAVYLCQARKRELFVLKELVVPADANSALQEKARELFDREARMLVALDHPGIVRVFDHFVENGRNYLLLEYLPGSNLRDLVMEQGPQREPDVLRWALSLCEVLHYLSHRQPPLVHRDLTPDNIVMTLDRSVVLIDFGASNDFIGKSTGTLVGKQCYMAPEQFRGKAVPASDIYSLGCTMFYLLTGEEPEPLTVLSPMNLKADVRLAVDAIVQKCTAMELSQRYASAAELRGELENALREYL